MTVVPTSPTAPAARESQHVSDVYGGAATSHTVSPGLPSISPHASAATSSAPSPTPSYHAKQFPLAAAVVLGFIVVSALFWAAWLALRRRRRHPRAYPEFASVSSVSVAPLVAGVGDENPVIFPRDEKEDDPFDAAGRAVRVRWRRRYPFSCPAYAEMDLTVVTLGVGIGRGLGAAGLL